MTWLLVGWLLVALLMAVGLGRSLRLTRVDVESILEGPGRASLASGSWSLGNRAQLTPVPVDELAEVHRMLAGLERHHPRIAKIVLLCWIGGLSPRSAAATLGVPEAMVEGDLRHARSLLRHLPGPGGID